VESEAQDPRGAPREAETTEGSGDGYGSVIGFVGLVLPVSWGVMLALGAGHSARATAIAMTCPLVLAAVFLSLEGKAAWSALGWGPPGWTYGGLSVGLPVAQLALVLLAGSAGGWIEQNPSHIINSYPTGHLGLNLVLAVPGMVIPFLLLSPGALLAGWVSHLGEEVAWRGYLFGALLRRGSHLPAAALVTGAVWWLWHLPFLFSSPILTSLPKGAFLLLLGSSLPALVGASAMYCWIYVASGSIWAPTLLHLFWNLYRGVLTGRLSDGAPGLFAGPLWLMNGEGVLGNLVSAASGVFFLVLLARRSGWGRPSLGPVTGS
jgi:membrane protease YdiL (CAAX protease family)